MHVLRFFLTPISVPDLLCAEARCRFRVLIERRRPLSRSRADNLAALCITARSANPTFSHPLTKHSRHKLPFKSHSAPRPPQTPAASS